MNTMFKVGSVDYSNRVVAGSYKIQTNDLYEEWTDANGTVHRMGYNEKTSGELTLAFKNITEYENFCSNLSLVKQDDLSYPVTVLDNISSTQKSFNAFIDFSVVRNLDGVWNDRVETITISVMEC